MISTWLFTVRVPFAKGEGWVGVPYLEDKDTSIGFLV